MRRALLGILNRRPNRRPGAIVADDFLRASPRWSPARVASVRNLKDYFNIRGKVVNGRHRVDFRLGNRQCPTMSINNGRHRARKLGLGNVLADVARASDGTELHPVALRLVA